MKRVAFNSVVLAVTNIGSAVLGFVLAIVIGRALGVDEFGRYTLALAWALALGLIAEFGLGTLLTRDLAREPGRVSNYLRSSTLFVTALSILLTIALVAVAPLLSPDDATILSIRLAAPLVLVSAVYMLFTAIFRAGQRMTYILILNVSSLVIQVALSLVLALRSAGANEFILLTLGVRAVQLLAAWLLYLFVVKPVVPPETETRSARELARASTPFAIAAGIGVAQMRVPLLLLGALSGDAAVGLYGAANRFSEAIKLVPSGFFGALFPALSQMAGAGVAELHYTFRRVERSLLLVGIISALGFTIAAAPLITLTYGAEFARAAPILVVLGWTLVPYFWGTMITLYLYSINDESYVNRIRGIGVAVQVALSIPLILTLGGLGAAIAALVGEIIASLLFRRRWAQLRSGHDGPGQAPRDPIPANQGAS